MGWFDELGPDGLEKWAMLAATGLWSLAVLVFILVTSGFTAESVIGWIVLTPVGLLPGALFAQVFSYLWRRLPVGWPSWAKAILLPLVIGGGITGVIVLYAVVIGGAAVAQLLEGIIVWIVQMVARVMAGVP